MRHPRVLILAAALLLTLAAAVGACGNNDQPTLDDAEVATDEYFERLLVAQDEFVARLQALGEAEFPGAFEVPDTLFDALSAVHRDYLAALGDIDPPAEVKAPHEAFLDAQAEIADRIKDLGHRLADVDSAAELSEVLDDTRLGAPGDRLKRACIALQRIALEDGIDAVLECEG